MKKVPNNSAKRAALTHLVRRKAVNIEFNDVSYSVSEGRRKGKYPFFILLFILFVCVWCVCVCV